MKRKKGESEAGPLRSERVKKEKGESESAGVCGSVTEISATISPVGVEARCQ